MTATPSPAVGIAYDIISKAGCSGRAVLNHASTVPVIKRGQFLTRAAKHFLSFYETAKLYRYLPVDVQTFVES